ncbi:MAG: Flp pilus assembly protein CpaB [Planctomycetaceae bacterium]|nr:Flp pilus assembly protein CpaB [Planctomycetaceae bacterium]
MRFLTPAMLTIILLLVVAGLVIAYVVKSLFAAEPVARVEPRLYPMAVADLEPGTIITASHLAQGPYSGESQRTFARSDSILIGRTVREKITAAAPIDTTKLHPPGWVAPVEVAIGMRAVSLALGDGAAVVDGLVKANEYVDVHFTPSGLSDQRFRGGLTMTMFKGVKVLAVNRSRTGATARGENTVTLELTPEQANIILLAKDKGQLNLTYTPDGIGNGGVALADDDRAFLEEILGLSPPPEPEKPFVTEHYHRGGRGVMAFGDDGTLWNGGYGNGYGDGNYAGYGDGGRQAPAQNGGHEPTGNWGGNYGGNYGGYYRGIDARGSQGNPNAPAGSDANGGVLRLIPSPHGSQPTGAVGSGAAFGQGA